jgi:hypothetical protein
VSLFADSLGDLSWLNGNLYLSKFITSSNTAARSYTFPNANGTVALTSDISYPVTSVFGRTGAVVATSGDYTTTQVTEGTNLYFTDARARAAISLTTTGTSGAATYVSGVLNIPQYQGVLTNPVTGTGTTNTLPKFTAASTIGNSNITDSGTLITLGSNTTISSGGLGIGSTGLTGMSLRLGKTITGATTSYGVLQQGIVQSDVTSTAYGFYNEIGTQASAFTLTSAIHYLATQTTLGAGSTITNQYGFFAGTNLNGATNNYGFYGEIASGTNRWNLYMAGTAANYMAGRLGIGTTTSVTNTSLVIGGADTQAIRISSATAAASYYTDFINYYNSSKSFEITSGGTSIFRSSQNGTISINIGQSGSLNLDISNANGWIRFNNASAELIRILANGSFGVGTGASINASAKVQIDSTTSGFLPPRMTTTQKNAIGTPATGLIVYQTDSVEGLYVYSGASWKSLTMV